MMWIVFSYLAKVAVTVEAVTTVASVTTGYYTYVKWMILIKHFLKRNSNKSLLFYIDHESCKC